MWWCYDWVQSALGFHHALVFLAPASYRLLQTVLPFFFIYHSCIGPPVASAQSLRRERLAVFLHSWCFFGDNRLALSQWIYFRLYCGSFSIVVFNPIPRTYPLYRLFWISHNLWMVHKNRYQLVCQHSFNCMPSRSFSPASYQPGSFRLQPSAR